MNIDRNEFFRKATVAITGTLNLQDAVDRCHALINTYFNLEALSFLVYDSAKSTVRHLARSQSSIWGDIPSTMITLPEYQKEFIDSFLRDNASFAHIINGPADIPHGERLIADLEKAGFLISPVMNRSQINAGLDVKKPLLAFLEALKPVGERATEEEAALLLMLKEPLSIVIANALAHDEVLKLKAMIEDDKRFFQEELHSIVGDRIIGEDSGLRNVMEMVTQVAPKNSPVMLFGETGVGKDLIANAIHYGSPRRTGPFIKVNCGAIPESLIDSELFGHEKGAFTGAMTQKRGRFERAHKGTIFLDEIGELPQAAQVRLLRVLQNKELERVGGTEIINVDVRVISATNQNIEEMVDNRRFREDLFFRLNVFPIFIPPLRQRKSDIPMLVQHLLEKKCIELKIPNPPALARGALERLVDHQWPGNVRELENMVERELIMNKGHSLQFAELGNGKSAGAFSSIQETLLNGLTLAEVDTNHILNVLKATNGKIDGADGAAQLLGLKPSTLRSRMKKLGILYRRNAKYK
ncbi:MAG TPA: sigma-54 dependent transcriptional regulator [bacterium]|nr:sigma-54 dependent transcriptional regulator [bacterium]